MYTFIHSQTYILDFVSEAFNLSLVSIRSSLSLKNNKSQIMMQNFVKGRETEKGKLRGKSLDRWDHSYDNTTLLALDSSKIISISEFGREECLVDLSGRRKDEEKGRNIGVESGIKQTSGWSRQRQINKNNRQIYFSADGQNLMNEGDSCLFPFSDSDLHRNLTYEVIDIVQGNQENEINVRYQQTPISLNTILSEPSSLSIVDSSLSPQQLRIPCFSVVSPFATVQEFPSSSLYLDSDDPTNESSSNGLMHTLSNPIETSQPSTPTSPSRDTYMFPKNFVDDSEMIVYLEWLESQQKISGGKYHYGSVFPFVNFHIKVFE